MDVIRWCSSCFSSSSEPLASSRETPFAQRRALDSRGLVGHFYDARKDQVIPVSVSNLRTMTSQSERSFNCHVEKKPSVDCPDLMGIHKINLELRLSVTLGLTPAEGIGALINYIDPIDEHTRFLNCTFQSHTQCLTDNQFRNLQQYTRQFATDASTHVIVSVDYGIDALVILRLPHDDQAVLRIDRILQRLCQDVQRRRFSITDNDLLFLSMIERTDIHSNDPSLVKCNDIIDFYRIVREIKQVSRRVCWPYRYNLYPINQPSMNDTATMRFHQLQSERIQNFESYLVEMKLKTERIRTVLRISVDNFTKHCKITYDRMCTECTALSHERKFLFQQLAENVIYHRAHGHGTERFYPLSDNPQYRQFQERVNDLYQKVMNLERKVSFIQLLPKLGFRYCDVAIHNFQSNESEESIRRKLLGNEQNIIILCSDDYLYQTQKHRWQQFTDRFREEKKQSRNLEIVHADFTYSEYKLHDFKLFRSNQTNSNIIQNNQASSMKNLRQKVNEDDYINILLLGQSGAGKSTFINAFANYLQFESFDDASRHEPIVLLPISFMLTSGTNFDEHHIEYHGLDPSSTEDFEAVGSSVTQFSKSYLMKITRGSFRGKKLRLIDTPGFGDTRGLDQDECNLHGILSFINNLQHLDAICLVMKPNISRSDIVFSSFIRQIFDVLGDRVGDHVMFCFTNTRSTFYGPGDTSPVLQGILRSLPGAMIPFDKSNVFCFDSESFRYLVAKKRKVPFDRDETDEYRNSWDRSSKESVRLLAKIIQKTTKYNLEEEHKSIQRTRLKILVLLRPMFESLRNLLRNKILSEKSISAERIILRAKPLDEPKLIRRQEARNLQRYGRFSMKEEVLTKVKGRVNLRDLAFHKLEFSCGNRINRTSNADESMHMLLKMLAASSMMLQSTGTETDDVVMMEFRRILEEERWIMKHSGHEGYLNKMIEYWKVSMESFLRYQNHEEFGERFVQEAVEKDLSSLVEEANMKVQWSAINETQRNIFKRNQFNFNC